MKQTIEEVDVAGKRVLMRVDFNVPMDGGEISDDRRIRMALPSINSVLHRGGTLTLMSHLGRPKGDGFEQEYTLAPVAKRLSELLGRRISFSDEDTNSEIILLENLRFHSGEKMGDETFAKKLTRNADIYCNDAFGTAHRNHASMVAVPQAMEGKPRVAGLLLAKELQFLDDAIANAQKPFLAVLGGVKVSDKMGAMHNLLGKVDTILTGGAMAYTFLAASGVNVGESVVEHDRVEEAKDFLVLARASSTDFLLPCDHVCAQQIALGAPVQVVTGPIPDGWMGLDIGPETIAAYAKVLMHAKTIVWNGPMGVFELEPFGDGTHQIAEAIAMASRNGATSIVGGGDIAAAITSFNLDTQLTHISTGGGASIQMFEGIPFNSVAVLDDAV